MLTPADLDAEIIDQYYEIISLFEPYLGQDGWMGSTFDDVLRQYETIIGYKKELTDDTIKS